MSVNDPSSSVRIALSFCVALVAGCSSSNATPTDAGAPDGTAPADGGSSGNDSGTSDAATDAGSSDAASAADSSPPADAGLQCSAPGATADSCRSCCANGYPAGSQVFDGFTVECACAPSLCGAPDAGVSAATEAGADDGGASDGGSAEDAGAAPGDGGLYGTGVCAATCTGKVSPDPVCNACILDTLGSVTDLGPCGSSVLSQCLNDVNCNAYFGCLENCPGS